MHIKLEGKALREALSKSNAAATRAGGYGAEVYSGVKVEADTNTVTVITTNGELKVKQKIPLVTLTTPGTLFIPREQLVRIAREAETIEIEEKKSQIHISAAGTTFRLNKPGAEPPEREAVKESRSFSLKGEELKGLLKHTLRFASRDPSRISLNGILLEWSAKELRAVATDGHRLSLSTLPHEETNEPMRVTIPSEVAHLILGLAAEEEDVEIRIGENTIETSGLEYEIQGALFEQEFPDYKKVIPTKNPHMVGVKRSDLLESLERLKILAEQRYCGVQLSFSKEELKLDIQNPNIGEATETLAIEGGDNALQIGMNVHYLIDALATISDEKVQAEINDATTPILLTGESRNPLIVIMPMKL